MIDAGLLKYATYKQRTYLEAVEKYGSGRAAEQALGLGNDAISKAIRLLKRRAAEHGYSPEHDMTHTVPDGFKVKGVSTYYNKDGIAAGQWVKSTADHEARLEAMKAAAEAMRAHSHSEYSGKTRCRILATSFRSSSSKGRPARWCVIFTLRQTKTVSYDKCKPARLSVHCGKTKLP